MAGQEMKYRQVIDWVRENVENGTFREGDKLLLEKDDIDGLIVEPVKSSLPNPNIRYYEEIMERG